MWSALLPTDASVYLTCLNVPQQMGRSPLHVAAYHGNVEVIKYLIEKDVDLYREGLVRIARPLSPVHN